MRPLRPAPVRLTASRGRGQQVMQLAGELLVTAAVVVVLLLVWQLWWTDRVAGRAAAAEITELTRDWSVEPATAIAPMTGKPPSGTAFAVLHVPRFGPGWRTPVVQGTGTDELRRGVGHYPAGALPGAIGNLGLAGHRTTWGAPFSGIARLRAGDPVVVETKAGWFVYRVTAHRIVRPGQREVLAPVPGRPGRPATDALLTMTSCHPKYSARERYVVHAELESSRARADGPPPIGGL